MAKAISRISSKVFKTAVRRQTKAKIRRKTIIRASRPESQQRVIMHISEPQSRGLPDCEVGQQCRQCGACGEASSCRYATKVIINLSSGWRIPSSPHWLSELLPLPEPELPASALSYPDSRLSLELLMCYKLYLIWWPLILFSFEPEITPWCLSFER